jgi:hypothetical protein
MSDASGTPPVARLYFAWLEHIPSGRNRPDGICLLQQISPARAFPLRWNRASGPMGQVTIVWARFHLSGNRSSARFASA